MVDLVTVPRRCDSYDVVCSYHGVVTFEPCTYHEAGLVGVAHLSYWGDEHGCRVVIRPAAVV